MKIKGQMLKSLAMVVGVALLAQAAGADPVTVELTTLEKHAYLSEASPNNSYSGSLFYVGTNDGANEFKSILAFDTSALDGINFEITGITLYLRLLGNSGTETRTHSVYAISQANGDWDGSAATWNEKDKNNDIGWAGSAGLGTAGTDYDATLLASHDIEPSTPRSWITFAFDGVNTDLTALVKSWMTGQNAGLLVQDDNVSNWTDAELVSYYTSTYNPKLEVTYTVVPEPATMAMLGLGGAMMLIRRRRNNA